MSLLFPGCNAVAAPAAPALCGITDDVWTSFACGGGDDDAAKPQAVARAQDGYCCPDCGTGKHIVVADEEVNCTRCGTHLGFQIDSSAEYRWFGSEDRGPDPSRVGNPLNPLLPESSLGTRILIRPGDSKAMRRIRQYHLWSVMPYRERTLWTVFEGLQVRASNAGISLAIVEETKQLYAQVSPLCICRGQQKDALLAACLFESLKRHGTPRRPVEIAEIFGIDVKLITRGVKQFSGLLEEHLHTETKAVAVAAAAAPKAIASATTAALGAAAPPPTVSVRADTHSTSFKHYLEPAIYKLETPRALHGQIHEFACRMGDMIDELGICPETTPSSLAACALALTCEKFSVDKSKADVAKVCSISAATLLKCMKRIESWRPVLFKGTAASE
jgi:transcription initiation factor TFIIIB Brf1 subunit/transcription initiation factor TFIIB